MDPDCAICHSPAARQCDCEAKGLEQSIRQAENRVMSDIYSEIRTWVRQHAQDYILEYFRLLTDRRKEEHSAQLERLQAHAYQFYGGPPHPSEMAQAQAQLKRGIDEDWQNSVRRYPEVLEYFYGLVELGLPADDEPFVKDPPLSALGSRKTHRRSITAGTLVAAGDGADGGVGGGFRGMPRATRTPPPPIGMEWRTPGPAMGMGMGMGMEPRMPTAPPPGGPRRGMFRPPPPASYFPPY
jgi:hypothetical protein